MASWLVRCKPLINITGSFINSLFNTLQMIFNRIFNDYFYFLILCCARKRDLPRAGRTVTVVFLIRCVNTRSHLLLAFRSKSERRYRISKRPRTSRALRASPHTSSFVKANVVAGFVANIERRVKMRGVKASSLS